MCDQISDAILDAHLKQDPNAKVACGKFTEMILFFFFSEISMMFTFIICYSWEIMMENNNLIASFNSQKMCLFKSIYLKWFFFCSPKKPSQKLEWYFYAEKSHLEP